MLCVQTLRKKLQETTDEENIKNFLLETYEAYKKVSKSNLKEPLFGNILNETYNKLSISKVFKTISFLIRWNQ